MSVYIIFLSFFFFYSIFDDFYHVFFFFFFFFFKQKTAYEISACLVGSEMCIRDSGKISSAACEYVFTRDVWKKTGGFVRFPLAWCSDDATWAKFADYASGIISLPGTPVYWRNAEDKNISNSTRFDGEKLKATGLFLKWIGMNYRLNLRESRFQDALVTYVNMSLIHI